MNALARFQDDFTDALFDDGADFAPARHRAFAVYRNTVMRACLDALEANYPAIVCLVGRDWFRAAAALYVAESPPRDARLSTYGEDFAGFLAAFPPAADLSYLPDVARLDRLWTECFVAADTGVLDAASVVSLAPDALGALRLRLHPAARSFASALPAVSIWLASRAGKPVSVDLAWRAEFAVITRMNDNVDVAPIEASAWQLLGSIGQGASLAEAALATLAVHPDARIDLLLASLLQAGVFAT